MEGIALLRCLRNTECSHHMLVAIIVADVWNILREEGHSDIQASLSQCSNSTWDYWNTNCFVFFSSEGLLAHSGSHFVWTDRLGSFIFFLYSLCLLLLTVQWLKPLCLGYLWKTEVAPELCNQNKQWLQSSGILVIFSFIWSEGLLFQLLPLWQTALLLWFLMLHVCSHTWLRVARVTCGDEGEPVSQPESSGCPVFCTTHQVMGHSC